MGWTDIRQAVPQIDIPNTAKERRGALGSVMGRAYIGRGSEKGKFRQRPEGWVGVGGRQGGGG